MVRVLFFGECFLVCVKAMRTIYSYLMPFKKWNLLVCVFTVATPFPRLNMLGEAFHGEVTNYKIR